MACYTHRHWKPQGEHIDGCLSIRPTLTYRSPTVCRQQWTSSRVYRMDTVVTETSSACRSGGTRSLAKVCSGSCHGPVRAKLSDAMNKYQQGSYPFAKISVAVIDVCEVAYPLLCSVTRPSSGYPVFIQPTAMRCSGSLKPVRSSCKAIFELHAMNLRLSSTYCRFTTS